jgi:hypothetical protein
MTKRSKLIGFDYSKNKEPEMIEIQKEVRVVYMGAFLGRDEAEVYREEFFTEFENDLKDGLLTVIQDDLVQINAHWVIRIMAQQAQGELDLE